MPRSDGDLGGISRSLSLVLYLHPEFAHARNTPRCPLDNRRYWVNGEHGDQSGTSKTGLREVTTYTPRNWYGGECLTGYYNRLQRDGWTLVSNDEQQLAVFQKPLSHGWTLEKHAHCGNHREQGKSVYWDAHILLNKNGDGTIGNTWEWADAVDRTAVYAEGGHLYRLKLTGAEKEGEASLIHDFNGYTFERREAPN